MQDSGNEFHTLSDAYEHTVVVQDLLAKLKLVTCGRSQLSVVESSRTHVEVLGLEAQLLGLVPYKSSKMPCPSLEDSIVF